MNGLSSESFLRQLYEQEKSQSKFYQNAPIYDQKNRTRSLDVIQKMGVYFKQRQKTIHLAIQYMDLLLLDEFLFQNTFVDTDFFDGPLSTLRFNSNLLGVTCMLLASKFYEPDENLIMISEIQQYMKKKMDIRLHYEDIQRCEVQALSKMQWDLFRVIPIDFLQTYELVQGFLARGDLQLKETKRLQRYRSSDQKNQRNNYDQITDTDELNKKVKQQVLKISDIVMQRHFEFVGFKPSVIALAIIDRARYVSEIKDNHSFLEQFNQDISQIQSCKKTLQKMLIEEGISSANSFVSEIPPSERSKSFIQGTCGEIPLSNSNEVKVETLPAMPPMVTLTGALKGLPKTRGVRNSIYQSKKEIETLSKVQSRQTVKRVYKTKTEMAPIVLRPQTQIVSQSQSISPVKAQMYKLQQKIEASRNDSRISPVEGSYKDKKAKYSQIKQSMKSDERIKTTTQLETVKVQSMKSISPVKNVAKQLLQNIIEKNGSRKETTNTSNHLGGLTSPNEEPTQYFCFNDFESSAQVPKCQKSGSGKKQLTFHKEKSSVFSKNYGSNNSKSSKEDFGRSSLSNTKSQMIHKKGQQSIFKTSKNDYSQKLLSNISKGLSSLNLDSRQQSSGLGLGQANRRIISSNAHKQEPMKLSHKFNSDSKKSVIDSHYSAVKPFQLEKTSQGSAQKVSQGSAQKLPSNHTPKALQFSAMSNNSKKNYHPRENISMFNRSRQTNYPTHQVKSSIVERRQIDLVKQKSLKKQGLIPSKNLKTKVFEIQLDAQSNNSDKLNDSTIIEADEDEPIIPSKQYSSSSQEQKRRTKMERRNSKNTTTCK